MIRFQNIYKSFGNLEVLKGVSHQINDGEVVTIIGPSGSGKGTVIQEFLKHNDKAWLSISCTSRNPRPGDVPNESYFFIGF